MREAKSTTTRAQDEIRLSNGDVMTLAQALDSGRVFLKTTEGFGRGGRLRGEVIELYIAKEVDGDLIWQVGKTFYESRMHGRAFGKTSKNVRPIPMPAPKRDVERLRDSDGLIWTVLPDSRFVENEDGERFRRLDVEIESGPLVPVDTIGEMRDGPSFSPSDRKKNAADIARHQRDQARAEIAAARQEAADARAACTAARQRAKDTCALAKTLRSKRDALVALAHEYRLIRRAELARLGKRAVPRAYRPESDEEVRNNIPPELVPTWEVEKRGIRGNARKSRTEEFLEWVEQHPSEIVYVEPSDEDYDRSYAGRRASEFRRR